MGLTDLLKGKGKAQEQMPQFNQEMQNGMQGQQWGNVQGQQQGYNMQGQQEYGVNVQPNQTQPVFSTQATMQVNMYYQQLAEYENAQQYGYKCPKPRSLSRNVIMQYMQEYCQQQLGIPVTYVKIDDSPQYIRHVCVHGFYRLLRCDDMVHPQTGEQISYYICQKCGKLFIVNFGNGGYMY
jgi:hypothetical protein